MTRAARLRRTALVVAVNLLVLGVALAAVELVLLNRYRASDTPRGPFGPTFRNYEMKYERRIVQFLPDCARYDAELAYTLAPPGCRFRNREFDTELRVNGEGLRDDEASLRAPAVIAVGDSFTMGWGVGQEETFAQVIEARLSLPVLNAGISSYGTARELRMLSRLDTSGLRVLLVQYHDNDAAENLAFLRNGNRLPVMSEARYRDTVREHLREARGYRFGLLLYEGQKLVVNGALRTLKGGRDPDPDTAARAHDEQARAFLRVLAQAPVDLTGVTVVVFELSDRGANDDLFIDAVRRELGRGGHTGVPRGLRLVSMRDVAGPDLHFPWDGHLRPEGHRAVAARLLETIGGDALAARRTP